MGDPRAPVVAGQEEALEPEPRHEADLVPGHDFLGVGFVVALIARLAAVTLTSQIGGDDGKVFRQGRRDLVPHGVGLRIAVQQEQPGPLAPALEVNAHIVDDQIAGHEFRE